MKHDEQQQIQEFHSNLFKIEEFLEGKNVDYNDLSNRAVDTRCKAFSTDIAKLVSLSQEWGKFLSKASDAIKNTQSDTKTLQSTSKFFYNKVQAVVDKYRAFCNDPNACLDGTDNKYESLEAILDEIQKKLLGGIESLLIDLSAALSVTSQKSSDLEMMNPVILGGENIKESLNSYYQHCCIGSIPSGWWSSWVPLNPSIKDSCNTLGDKLKGYQDKLDSYFNAINKLSISGQPIYINYQAAKLPNILNVVSMDVQNLESPQNALGDQYDTLETGPDGFQALSGALELLASKNLWGDLKSEIEKIKLDVVPLLKKCVSFNETLAGYAEDLSGVNEESSELREKFSSLSVSIGNSCIPLLFESTNTLPACDNIKTSVQEFTVGISDYQKLFFELSNYIQSSIKKTNEIAVELSVIENNVFMFNGSDTRPDTRFGDTLAEPKGFIGGLATLISLGVLGVSYYQPINLNYQILTGTVGFFYNITNAFSNYLSPQPFSVPKEQELLSILDIFEQCKSDTSKCGDISKIINHAKSQVTEYSTQINKLINDNDGFVFNDMLGNLNEKLKEIESKSDELKKEIQSMTEGNGASESAYALNKYYEYVYIKIAVWAKHYSSSCPLYKPFDDPRYAKTEFQRILKSLYSKQSISDEDSIKTIVNEVIDKIIEPIVSKIRNDCSALLISDKYFYKVKYSISDFGNIEASRISCLDEYISKTYAALYFSRVSPACKNAQDTEACVTDIIDTVYKSSDSYSFECATQYICKNPALDWGWGSTISAFIPTDCNA